jgi:mono/diheme cytochrome c family protein
VRWILAAILVAVALAGCGSASRSGAGVFARACAACHSLVGNESRHKQGGDLLGYRLTRAEWLQFTREMPVKKPLTDAEVAAVVDYILRITR